jgi:hypothetical protein
MNWMSNFDKNYTASFKRKTLTPDGMGGSTETITTVKTLKVALWQQGAGESYYSNRVHNDSTHIVACDPFDGLEADDYCVIGSDTYDIDQPDNVYGAGDIMTIGLTLRK